MKTNIDDLKNEWQKAKNTNLGIIDTVENIIATAEKKKKSSIRFQFINIIILTITVIVIWAFFEYTVNLNFIISKIGSSFMIWSLVLRIIIEIMSILKAQKMDLTKSVLETTSLSIDYYKFRKFIHGPVTIAIVALYSIGFYMLTPEFSNYFSLPIMVLIDSSYIIGGAFMLWQIRKGILNELKELKEIVSLRTKLAAE